MRRYEERRGDMRRYYEILRDMRRYIKNYRIMERFEEIEEIWRGLRRLRRYEEI